MSATTTTPDPEAVAAARAAFPDAYAASGLPPQAFPAFQAQFGQESSYGAADPANPLRVTAATAANPGYGLTPMNPADLNDPSKAPSNILFGLRYAKQLAAAKHYDLTTPEGVASTLEGYNGVGQGAGDPNYVQHVAARMPSGSFQTAMNGASDVDNPMPAQPQQAASQQQPAQPAPAAPALSYTPPPMPGALQQALNDNTGLVGNNQSRDLIALGAGLLQGHTLGQGLGLGLQGVLQQRDQQQRNALSAYEVASQQASQYLLAQRYAGQLGIAQMNADTKGGQLGEKVRHDGVTEGQGGVRLGIDQQNADTNGIRAANQGAIGAANAETSRDRAGIAAATVGAPAPAPIAPGSLPGFGAAGLTGGTMSPAPSPGPAGGVPAASVSPAGTPSQGTSGLFSGPVAPSSPATSGAPAGLPGVGASGLSLPPDAWPSAALNTGVSPALAVRNKLLLSNNHRQDLAGDEAAALVGKLTTANTALQRTGTDIDGLNASPVYGTGGLRGELTGLIGGAMANPLVGDIQKNHSDIQLGTLASAHLGRINLIETKAAGATSPGLDTPAATAHAIIASKVADNDRAMDVATGEQAWMAAHPGQDPDIGYAPIANDYQRQFPAYTTAPDGTVTAAPRPTIQAFAQQHTRNGVYVPLASDPEAQAAGARAFPNTTQPAASAPASSPTDPAALIRSRLADPQFRALAIRQNGQAWVDSYEGTH